VKTVSSRSDLYSQEELFNGIQADLTGWTIALALGYVAGENHNKVQNDERFLALEAKYGEEYIDQVLLGVDNEKYLDTVLSQPDNAKALQAYKEINGIAG
jgi:hypothetical protein